ncbi:MAG: hypothetical protein H6Q44_586 [Deltaproteobacteria bacterium]|nr:hypothetical protein [Deltaproteobacteria bacterium]
MKTLSFFIFALALAWNTGAAEEQFPVGHPDQGLPRPEFVPAPYHEDPNHALNRVFRASFLSTVAPAEVGLALPREHGDPAEFFRKPWYFAVRPGTPADRKLFGGDVRLLSREGFAPDEAPSFARALAEVDGEAALTLKKRPELAALFQHDLLRLAQRLMETGRNPELLRPIGSAVNRVALTPAQLSQLPSTYDLGLKNGSLDSALPQDLLRVDPPGNGTYLELLRNSTRVFDASRTLAWSRVFISWPSAREGLMGFLSAHGKDGNVEVPTGTISVLVQGVVAVDDRGRPHATSLAFDVRVKWLANRDPMSGQNRTTSRDGIQIRAYELRRASLRQGAHNRLFRLLHDDDQALFRDYGTLKHTTLAAQCTLCHRLHGVSDAYLGGFITLGPSARPRPATTGSERLRLAEREASQFLASIEKAAKD